MIGLYKKSKRASLDLLWGSMPTHVSGVGNGRVPLSEAVMGERARTREMKYNFLSTFLEKNRTTSGKQIRYMIK